MTTEAPEPPPHPAPPPAHSAPPARSGPPLPPPMDVSGSDKRPDRRHRRVARPLIALGAIVIAGLVAFGVSTAAAHLDASHLKPVPLPRATTPAPSPRPLTDVGRGFLPVVVTIAADRTNEEALGTGWLLDSKGDFVTNAHVVEGQLAVRITDRQAHTHVATVLGSDAATDVAVLRSQDGFAGTPLPVDATPLATVPLNVIALASSRATTHGDLTLETITDLHQDVPLASQEPLPGAPSVYHDMLELHGSRVYQGNSGGPVVDQSGAVVGIITLSNPSGAAAYAIPISRVIAELRQFAAR